MAHILGSVLLTSTVAGMFASGAAGFSQDVPPVPTAMLVVDGEDAASRAQSFRCCGCRGQARYVRMPWCLPGHGRPATVHQKVGFRTFAG